MKKKLLLPLVCFSVFAPTVLVNNLATNAIHISNYENTNQYKVLAEKVATQIADEGTVLLKNDGFLPMKGNEKISVFGKSSVNMSRFAGSAIGGTVLLKSIDLYSSLENAGFKTNQTLRDFYKNDTKSGKGRTNGNTGWTGVSEVTIGETSISSYSTDIINTFSQYNDAAIFVITREGSEGCDIKTYDARDTKDSPATEKHALELSDNESALYSFLHEHFNHIIIILDTSSSFECDQFQKDPKTSAVIWTGGYSGDVGLGTIGKILNGSVNPSGRTVDTWARDFTKNPAFKNFSDNAQTNIVTDSVGNRTHVPQDTMYKPNGDPVRSPGTLNAETYEWVDETNKVVKYGVNGVRPSSFVKYEEDIYIDYRYYETVYDDKAVSDTAAAETWYSGDEGVVYPFGYGLSYTKFTQTIESINYNENNNAVTTKVRVKNIGEKAGKEVVQLYLNAPYTKGGIEKASTVLCAFGKTQILKPKEYETIELKLNLQDFASYDAFDANHNGFKGYELEKGDYFLTLKHNAHDRFNDEDSSNLVERKIALSEDIKISVDRHTGKEVTNQFTYDAFSFFNTLPTENDIKFTRLSRNDKLETIIGDNSVASRTLKENSRVEEYLTHKFTIEDVDLVSNSEYISHDVFVSKDTAVEKGFRQKQQALNQSERTQASEMIGVSFDDEARWNSFLNEFTYNELLKYVSGSISSPSQSSIALKYGSEGNGPGKYSYVQFPSSSTLAATYNVELAADYGECVGEEANLSGKYGWWAPYATIRRSPFVGRSLYYYSSDPLLAGKMVANTIKTAGEKGVVCYVNGFGLGNQEKNREGGIVYASEQAIREIYLKSFQYAVEEGKAVAITTSYQRVGLVEAANNYPLLNNILKNEWGFKGVVMGDMTHSRNGYIDFDCFENINYRLLSGLSDQIDTNNNWFKNNMNCSWDDDAFDGNGAPVFIHEGTTVESYSWWNAVRNSAKARLYVAINYVDIKGNNLLSNDNIQIVTNFNADEHSLNANTNKNSYVLQKDKPVTLNVNLLNNLSGKTCYIDESTPLPKGLTFANNAITGAPLIKGKTRINILVKNNDIIYGKRIELIVTDIPILDSDGYIEPENPPIDNPIDNLNEEKGCKGSIVSELPIMLLSVMGGIILLTVSKKEDKA